MQLEYIAFSPCYRVICCCIVCVCVCVCVHVCVFIHDLSEMLCMALILYMCVCVCCNCLSVSTWVPFPLPSTLAQYGIWRPQPGAPLLPLALWSKLKKLVAEPWKECFDDCDLVLQPQLWPTPYTPLSQPPSLFLLPYSSVPKCLLQYSPQSNSCPISAWLATLSDTVIWHHSRC